MRKRILFFLFIILSIALFVSCDAQVNKKLFEVSSSEENWTVKVTYGNETYYANVFALVDTPLYSDPQCQNLITSKIMIVTSTSGRISFQIGDVPYQEILFDTQNLSSSDHKKILPVNSILTIGTSPFLVTFNVGTFLLPFAS